MASVAFEHVDKVFPDGTRALSDCTLRVDDGELLVCVGPSGCGKSTLLRVLAGLEPATRGSVRIGDRVVNDLTPQARNVAMVFQDYALYPFMSVRGNLEFPLKMRKLSRDDIRRRVERVAGLLDIASLLERLPKHLSGGQRQRVAMGRALVREPAVFLLDEPLSNLDAKLRVQVRAEIRELQQRTRTTMIYVTHDQVEAMTLGDRVAVLHQGRLQQIAAPRDLYDHPANVFVAGFIGNPPMNLFPTRLVRDAHGRPALTVCDQLIPLSRLPPPAQSDRRWTAGIRPEAIGIPASDATDGCLSTTIEQVEYLGHETLAYVRVGRSAADGGVHLVARLHGMRQFAPEESVRLHIETGQVHLFDEDGTASLAQ